MNQILRHKKNTALTLVFPLTDADGQPITGAGGLDTEESHDGSAFTDTANEMAEIGVTGFYAVTITAGELNYDTIVITLGTSTAGIMPLSYEIHTYEDGLETANVELAAIPDTTGTLRELMQFLFEYFRNKRTETAGTESLKKEDASTELGSRTLADDGSTFTRGEMS